MRLRIDQKEDLLHELCGKYGLELEYAWGTYHISNGVITRTELHEMSADCIEETVLRYALLAGF